EGDVLAEIVVPELAQEAAQKQALTRQADADAELARKAHAAAEANVTVAEAAIGKAKALYERWESESSRIDRLVRQGTIDKQASDETLNQFKAAAAEVQSANANVLKAKADRDKSAAAVK